MTQVTSDREPLRRAAQFDLDDDFDPVEVSSHQSEVSRSSWPGRRAGGQLLSRLLIAVALVVLIAGAALLAYNWSDIALRLAIVEAPTQGSTPAQSTAAQRISVQQAGKEHVVFSGPASELTVAPGNVVQQEDSSTPPTIWLRSSVTTAQASGTDTVSATVSRSLSRLLEGRRIVVTVTTASPLESATPFAVAYSAGRAGNSGWMVFTPSKHYKDHSFTYAVPVGPATDEAAHTISVWSDIAGRGSPLALHKITVRIAD